MWEIVHVFFHGKTFGISVEKMFSHQKLFAYTFHTAFEFTTMAEALIELVCQYPALWDKQDVMYKDSNFKEAKWKETAEILHLNKEDVIRKCKSLRDTFVRHKSIKSKSGDGLSQCKPKWKYYDTMSFIDITLLKQRYVPIYLKTSYIQHRYIQWTIMYYFDQINSGKIIQKCQLVFQFDILFYRTCWFNKDKLSCSLSTSSCLRTTLNN